MDGLFDSNKKTSSNSKNSSINSHTKSPISPSLSLKMKSLAISPSKVDRLKAIMKSGMNLNTSSNSSSNQKKYSNQKSLLSSNSSLNSKLNTNLNSNSKLKTKSKYSRISKFEISSDEDNENDNDEEDDTNEFVQQIDSLNNVLNQINNQQIPNLQKSKLINIDDTINTNDDDFEKIEITHNDLDHSRDEIEISDESTTIAEAFAAANLLSQSINSYQS